jgi:hypothetical protein
MTTFPVVLIYSSLGDWQRDNDGHCNASDDLQPWRLATRKPLTLSCVYSTDRQTGYCLIEREYLGRGPEFLLLSYLSSPPPNQVRQQKWLPFPFSLPFYSLYSMVQVPASRGREGVVPNHMTAKKLVTVFFPFIFHGMTL